MKIGYYQFIPQFGKIEKNLTKIESVLKEQIDLLVLPELCTSGYQFVQKEELNSLAEEIPNGNSTQTFIKLAKKIEGTIVAGLPEKGKTNFYNTAIVVNPSGFVGKYRKIHLFFEEEDFFSPGNLPFPVFDIGLAKIGIMICFDWFFPEAARTLALKSAEIICLPANLVLPYCQRTMKIRALENVVYTVVANRIGTEQRGKKKPLIFTGESQIADCKGEIICASPDNQEHLAIVEIDPELTKNKWFTSRNHIFSDRRPDFYEI